MTRKQRWALGLGIAGAVSGFALPSQAQIVVGSPFVMDGPAQSTTGSREQPTVVVGGGRYFAAWVGLENGFLQLEAAMGTPGANATQSVTVNAGSIAENAPAVAYTGSRFLLAWRATTHDGTQISAQLFDAAGNSQGEISQPAVSNAMPAVACDGREHCVLIWETTPSDLRNGTTDLTGIELSTSGSLNIAVNALEFGRPFAQRHPAIAYTGRGYQLAWIEEALATGVGPQVYTVRIGGVGTWPTPMRLSSALMQYDWPAVACELGVGCLVGWQNSTGIELVPIAADGTPASMSSSIAGSAPIRRPTLDHDGVRYVLAYEGTSPDAAGRVLVAQAVDANAAAHGPPAIIPNTPQIQPVLTAVSTGVSLLGYTHVPPSSDIDSGVIEGRLLTETAECTTDNECISQSGSCSGRQCISGYCIGSSLCADGGLVDASPDASPDATLTDAEGSSDANRDAGSPSSDSASAIDGTPNVVSDNTGYALRGGACACSAAGVTSARSSASACALALLALLASSRRRRASRARR